MAKQSVQPLIALDAVVLDTETTGLDPAKARIVQIGAVRLVNGQLVRQERFERLVDPGVPIPASATAIHHIDDAAVKGAPGFADAFDALEEFRGGRVVVGHNLGFDLAIFRRECRLAGRTYEPPASLDTRLLGQICFPSLAGFTLEILAERTGVTLDRAGRHDAVGDAESAGAIFVALLPFLKDKGVRTVAEANEACRRLTDAMEGFARAGWEEPKAVVAAGQGALSRIDSYPFRHRVSDVMGHPPAVTSPAMPLIAAARLMMERRISSLFVAEPDRLRVDQAGIVTERDVMRAVANGGAAALDRPVGEIASRPLAFVEADDFVYRAIGRMDRLKVRHLAVADATGRIVGALSARDLLKMRASDALALGDAIEAAQGAPAMAAAFARMPVVARQLLSEEVPATAVAAVISHEIGALTARAAREAEAMMVAEGAGPAPVAYAVLVLGSVGRGESLLAADQDNAVVTAVPDDPEAADRWFAQFGVHLSNILDAAGVVYCKGGVMARNPGFRGSIDDWRARIGDWIGRTRPEDLLAVDIFFDFRAVHGDMSLAATLFDEAYAAAHRAPMLAKLLAEQIGTHRPPLTLFGGFKLTDGRIDLKIGGLFPVVAAARCLALRHDVRMRSTRERIQALREKKIGAAEDLERWLGAHGVIVGAILRQQIADLESGRPPGSRVDPSILAKSEQAQLKTAIGHLAHVGETVKDLLFQT
ncbi:MAG: DNA polymerase III subunit epsilon [Xanthobacteraceae bacterium]|nr:MAG: DNA polymerase III subunit epsilon [Xanthobacteraceae bacterium]